VVTRWECAELSATDTGGQSRRGIQWDKLIVRPSQHEGRCTNVVEHAADVDVYHSCVIRLC